MIDESFFIGYNFKKKFQQATAYLCLLLVEQTLALQTAWAMKDDATTAEEEVREVTRQSLARNEDEEESPIRILTIDGGGIRGIIPAQFLTKFEEQLKKKIGREVKVAENFDLIAGTSTGGIIALGLNVPEEDTFFPRPRYNAKELVNLYQKHGDYIFSKSILWAPSS